MKNIFCINIDFDDNISFAMPTSVEIIGVFESAHSNMACGPPSTLEATIYKFKQLYNSLIFFVSTIGR